MPPDPSDAALLWDMLTSARDVLAFAQGSDLPGYLQNLMMRRAVEREIEIIGEAARKVSENFQQQHPEIPWRSIVAQRHVLAHQYGEIKQDLIWRVITVHIPELIAKLEPLIPSPPDQTSIS